MIISPFIVDKLVFELEANGPVLSNGQKYTYKVTNWQKHYWKKNQANQL